MCGKMKNMVNVQLNDAVAAALNARAAAQGLSLPAYLERLAQMKITRPAPPQSIEEFDRLLDEESTIGPSPPGTFSRSDIYSDHD